MKHKDLLIEYLIKDREQLLKQIEDLKDKLDPIRVSSRKLAQRMADAVYGAGAMQFEGLRAITKRTKK